MTLHLGKVPAGSTLYIPFATYGGTDGESITLTGLAVTDIEIYKNGSTTQRASDAGYALLDTDGIDFDGITGLHGFSIDLSDNTDSGFYAVGSFYWVVVSAVTVDAQTVNFIAATFRIGPAESITGHDKVDLGGIGGDAQSMTDLKDFADAGYDPSTNKVQGLVLADAVTGVPTLTQLLAAFGGVTGAVEDDAGNSSTVFQTNLAETADDYYNGGSLVFTSGTNIGQVRKISDYTGSTGTVTVGTAFDAEPGTGDTFLIVGRIE